MIPTCPKCGHSMVGPRFEPETNSLRYQCTCGYTMSEPANDQKGPMIVDIAKDTLGHILNPFGIFGR